MSAFRDSAESKLSAASIWDRTESTLGLSGKNGVKLSAVRESAELTKLAISGTAIRQSKR